MEKQTYYAPLQDTDNIPSEPQRQQQHFGNPQSQPHQPYGQPQGPPPFMQPQNSYTGPYQTGYPSQATLQYVPALDSGVAHPVLIFILSFIFPGVGHLIIGQTDKGVSYLIAFLILIILTLIPYLGLIIAIIGIVYRVVVAVDGYAMANKAWKVGQIGAGECFSSFTAMIPKMLMNGRVYIFVS